jgi:hypothetical protein
VDGSWIVWTGRTEQRRRVAYSADEIDYFGLVTGNREVYLVPVTLVEGQTSLCLRRYQQYRLVP